MKFKKGDWVKSVRRGSKGAFIGEIIETSQGDYVVRDSERRRWAAHRGRTVTRTQEGSRMTILTAKTEGGYCIAAALPNSLPLGGWTVDVDPDQLDLLDPEDYEETCGLSEAA